MKLSTKHAVAQRILALVGFALFIVPIWVNELGFYPPALLFIGFAILLFAILSGSGVGPWGRYYSSLVVSENEALLKSLEPKQPWQN